ncbi:MAG: hypothetical protein WKF58_11630 [Ilumatobacteraceae bacterium]
MSAVERRSRRFVNRRARRRSDSIGSTPWQVPGTRLLDLLAVRSRASSLLARHPLRAADAGHLAAALLVAEADAAGRLGFVCLDHQLNTAADIEGLEASAGVV